MSLRLQTALACKNLRSRGWSKDSELWISMARTPWCLMRDLMIEFNATAQGWSSASHMCAKHALEYGFLVKDFAFSAKEFADCPTSASMFLPVHEPPPKSQIYENGQSCCICSRHLTVTDASTADMTIDLDLYWLWTLHQFCSDLHSKLHRVKV